MTKLITMITLALLTSAPAFAGHDAVGSSGPQGLPPTDGNYVLGDLNDAISLTAGVRDQETGTFGLPTPAIGTILGPLEGSPVVDLAAEHAAVKDAQAGQAAEGQTVVDVSRGSSFAGDLAKDKAFGSKGYDNLSKPADPTEVKDWPVQQ
jgi:hypothetical protein